MQAVLPAELASTSSISVARDCRRRSRSHSCNNLDAACTLAPDRRLLCVELIESWSADEDRMSERSTSNFEDCSWMVGDPGEHDGDLGW